MLGAFEDPNQSCDHWGPGPLQRGSVLERCLTIAKPDWEALCKKYCREDRSFSVASKLRLALDDFAANSASFAPFAVYSLVLRHG